MAELIRATGSSYLGPLPGSVDFRQDRNTTRLYAIWTRDTPFIGNITVNWWFDKYGGSFSPTEDDRERDAASDRLVYAYSPAPDSPFRRGTFRTKQWEAWTIVAPALDVQTAEISVESVDLSTIIMLGSAITRNGVVAITDGPTDKTAHCWYDFGQQ